jgi:hypothetical protein
MLGPGATAAYGSASLALTGQGGPAGFVISPGTFEGASATYNSYDYNFPHGNNITTTFTLTNNSAAVSSELLLASDPLFSVTNDTCSGKNLAVGASCTFDLTFTAYACGTAGVDDIYTATSEIGTTPDFGATVNEVINLALTGTC